MLTSVRLDPSSDLTSADIVEEGDILTKDRSEVGFAEALGTDFRSVRPDTHEDHVCDEHSNTCEEG